MAIYYVDNVAGSDANGGTVIGLPKATIASANTAASASDTILLRTVNGANHPIASLTLSKGVNIETYYPDIAGTGKAILTGTTALTIVTISCNFYNIHFQNTINTNLNTVNCNITTKFNYCEWTRNISFGGSLCLNVAVNNATAYLANCSARSINATKFGTCFGLDVNNASSTGSIILRECLIKNFVTGVATASSGVYTINAQGTVFKDGTNALSLFNNIISLKTYVLLENNTIFNYTGAVISNLYTSAGTWGNIHVRFNYFGAGTFWASPTGITHFNLMNEYNGLPTGFNTTSYSSNNDVIGISSPMFINTSIDNFEIEVGSPLNNVGGNYIGAKQPDYINSYTDPGIANVDSSISYKFGSTTNNRTGTLSVSYLSVGNVKIGVDRGDGNIGTYDGSDRWSDPGIANVRLLTAYKANSNSNNRTGTAAIPTAAETKIGVSVDATIGTYDGSDRWSDPGINNVAFGIVWKANSLTNNRTGNRTDANPVNVLTGSGDYGALGTQFTPSYTPDFPSTANVTTDDTTNGQAGLIPNSKVMADAGGTLALNKVHPDNGGTLDLPALSSVDPADTLENQAGTLDLPSLSSVDPLDTLKGQNGTLDLPSLNSLLLTDTLRGVAGTVRLPTEDLVALNYAYGPNDSLTGELAGADLSNFTFIQPANVRNGLVYLYNGSSFTGTMGYRPPVPEGDVMKNLTSSIKSEIEFVLDDDTFKELQYVNEIEKNAFKNNFRRYGVLAKTANEIPGPFGYITLEQGYDFILTDGFMNKPMTDEVQRERTLFLQDQCYQIYKTLQKTKCGIPDTCINVKDLIISEPLYIEKDNVIVMTSNIKVIYRQRI